MSEQKASIGRIVEFFPGSGDSKIPLPNSMTSAPAIVTQTFDGSDYVNLTVFTVASGPDNNQTLTAWSIAHKDKAVEGCAYWDWPARV